MNVNVAKPFMYSLCIASMIFAGTQLGKSTKARAEASCCTYGQDCTTKSAPRCCVPLLEADCSETQKNYCRLRCS
jgi:hypothetical protein